MNRELIKAIVVLPGTVLVYVPGAILWLVTEFDLGLVPARLEEPRLWIGLVLGVSGFAFAVWTVRLFRFVGEGTPAPWAPPKNLVVRGPYRHVRNPMITSVLVMLAAESLCFGAWHLAGRGARARAAVRRQLSALQNERAALDPENSPVGSLLIHVTSIWHPEDRVTRR